MIIFVENLIFPSLLCTFHRSIRNGPQVLKIITELYIQRFVHYFVLNLTSIGESLFQKSSQFQINSITDCSPIIKGEKIAQFKLT